MISFYWRELFSELRTKNRTYKRIEGASKLKVDKPKEKEDPRQSLMLLFNEDAEFVIKDPTEIERLHPHKTEYDSALKDGKRRGSGC